MKDEVSDNHGFELVLEKRERSYSFGEPRIGAVALREHGEQDVNKDSQDLSQLVDHFENLDHDKIVSAHGELTTDPYVAVANGKTQTVDKHTVQQWVNSEQFKKAKGTPGQAKISDTKINFTDPHTASVNYQVKEGNKTARSSVIAVKSGGKWRVAVHSQHPV